MAVNRVTVLTHMVPTFGLVPCGAPLALSAPGVLPCDEKARMSVVLRTVDSDRYPALCYGMRKGNFLLWRRANFHAPELPVVTRLVAKVSPLSI